MEEGMKHIILTNPVSGKQRGLKQSIIIQKLLQKYHISSSIIVSEYPGHLTKLAHDLSQTAHCRFYCVGGDGSLNEIISGIIGSNSEIVVIPCGTGNDFLRSISDYNSLRKIIIASINQKAQKADVLKLNHNRYCINILNMGFDALVAKNVDKFRKFQFLSGKLKYNLSIFYTLLSSRNFHFKIRLDHTKIYKGNFTLAVIANGKYYGGGIKPCPNACVNDGLISTCIVDSTSLFQKLFFLPSYKKGKHITLKQAHIDQVKEVVIVSTEKFPVSIDGEVIYTNKLSAKILKDAINVVYIPKS